MRLQRVRERAKVLQSFYPAVSLVWDVLAQTCHVPGALAQLAQ